MSYLKSRLNDIARLRERGNSIVDRVTVEVLEKTARKALRIKPKEPLVYRGLTLICTGSRRWREKQQTRPQQTDIESVA